MRRLVVLFGLVACDRDVPSPASSNEPPSPPTRTAASTATATASAASTATATPAPSTAEPPPLDAAACKACDDKPHRMCGGGTDNQCWDACLVGWGKVGATHCGKICKQNADCAPDLGTCQADMASNEGVSICDEKWMGLGNHVED